jgi:hypothetical protein
MKRAATAFLCLLGAALSLGACEGDGSTSSGGAGYAYAACNQYASCEACTPIQGCGWCYKDDGAGVCADDPNDCATATSFRWTWEPTGCRVTADAGVNLSDGSSKSQNAEQD